MKKLKKIISARKNVDVVIEDKLTLVHNKVTVASYILAGFALIVTLQLKLISALLAGFLIFQLVQLGEKRLSRFGVLPRSARLILLIIITSVVISLLALGIISAMPYLRGESESLVVLMQRMADEIDTARSHLPVMIQNYLPNSLEEWQVAVSEWLRENAAQLGSIGKGLGIFIVHLIIGMIIGGLVAIDHKVSKKKKGELTSELKKRIGTFNKAFGDVVFSQIKISALNTFLTSIFLLIILPIFATPLPFTTTIIIATFLLGLLPIVGNLISNSIIFVIALSISTKLAVASLAYLVIIHKLEYFVNAKIIGNRIQAHPWELLIVMLIMEAAFGIPGLVVAPIYYAYIKKEFSSGGLI